MTTRMTEGCETVGCRPLFSRLAARGFDARSSRARAAPSLNLKKKRDCSQSITFRARGAGVEEERKKFCKRGLNYLNGNTLGFRSQTQKLELHTK